MYGAACALVFQRTMAVQTANLQKIEQVFVNDKVVLGSFLSTTFFAAMALSEGQR
jgi:hypothetical protein